MLEFMARPKIGEVLLRMGFISEAELQTGLRHQKQWGTPLARAVTELKFCTLDQVMQALSEQTGLPRVDLAAERLDPQLAAILPIKVAEQHHLVPLRVEGKRNEVLVIAIAAPATISSLDAVQSISGKLRINALLATDEAIEQAIGVVYRGERAERRPVPQAVVNMSEQQFDPASQGPLAPGPTFTEALTLSAECRRVIQRAAEHHRLSEAAVIERVVEAWASRQRGS